MDIFEDLEILILQNEDDFDRGSGKFILRKFIKEKQAEQLTLTDVGKKSGLLKDFLQYVNCSDTDSNVPIDLLHKYLNSL